MASTRSSKRSAADAQLVQPEVVVVTADPTVVAPPADVVPMTDDKVQAQGGPVAIAPVEGFAAPAADDETVGHKAKRLATDASKQVQEAVTAGLETATVAVNSAIAQAKAFADKELVRTTHSNAPTAASGPYNLKASEGLATAAPVEPTLRDKAHNTLNEVQFAIERGAEATAAAAKSAMAQASTLANSALINAGHVVELSVGKAQELKAGAKAQAANSGITKDSIKTQASAVGAGIKEGAVTAAAQVQATAAQLGAAISHATGSEISKDADASHRVEKKEGSLPVERNSDEFPHAKRTFESDSRILAGDNLQPGSSGLGTDVKIVDDAVLKIDRPVNPDLITEGHIQQA